MQSSAALLAVAGIDPPKRRAGPKAGSVTIEDRCENWAQCYRDRMRQGRAESFEGTSRSTRGNEIEWSTKCPITGKWLGYGSTNKSVARDWNDAEEINGAWQSIPDAFHQAVLGGHYVRKWSPDKCVRIGRALAGDTHQRREVSDSEFNAVISMGHSLITEQLGLPAVFRRAHLALRVRAALDLDEWIRVEASTQIS